MWFRRGRIRTRSTGATPEPISQALLQCCITALRTTAAAIAILIEAPGTVLLRLGRFFDTDDNCENSRNEKQKPHEPSLLKTPTPIIYFQHLARLAGGFAVKSCLRFQLLRNRHLPLLSCASMLKGP